ncbi:MAG: ParB/RepB/Spo0J family partition protein [Candidatus Paceibacterota bacterium]
MGMKDQFDRAGNKFKIPFEMVILAPNARKTFVQETIAVLANLLMLQGQREAGKGYLHTDGKHFVVTAGQRRYKAMLYANDCMGGEFKHIECDLEEKDPTTGKPPEGPELMIRQMVDGTTQEKLCAEDQAIAIKELIEKHGFSKSEIARRLGCTDQHIRDLLKFLEAPYDIKQAVKKGAISSTAALKIARARKEVQEEVAERVARGERVKNADVDFNDGKQSPMTPKEVMAQIKIADKYFNLPKSSDKDRAKYRAMIEAFRITQRQADPLK